jgi:hypothetical protein
MGCTGGAPVVTTGVSASSICRGSGLAFQSGTANRNYISINWTQTGGEDAAISGNDYLEFTLTPASGFKVTVTDVTIRGNRSGSGPTNISIRSSADGYATQLATLVTSGTTGTVNLLDIADIETCDPITFRVYGWGATSTGGTFRLEATAVNLTNGIVVNGSVAAGTCGGGDPVGGCCVSGVCQPTQVTEAACQNLSGTWLGENVACDGTNCLPPVGGCCIAGECTQDVTQGDCEAFQGTWLGANVECDGSNCAQPTGACCLPNGMCEVQTSANCGTAGGVYRGNGIACETVNCLQSCCFTDGTCQLLSVNDCATAGGANQSPARFVCSPNTCTQPAWTGACCEGTACNVRTFADCSAINGAVWLGKNAPCESGTCEQTTAANLIAKVDFDVNRQWSTFVIDTDHGTGPFDTGDAFGVLQRFTVSPEPVPFNLLDDTTSLFPAVASPPSIATAGDNLGVIPESKIDHFFGVVDIKGDTNGNYVINPAAPRFATATWTFDISGRSNISVQFDAAAMGDFERAATCSSPPCDEDTYTFKVSIDGGAETTIFDARADQDINETYTMAGGGMFTLDDPLVDQVSMVVLSNSFQTFSASVSGTGATLTLKFEGYGDGAAEVFAFDNIMIMGDSGTLTPCQKAASYAGNTGLVEVGDLFAFLDLWFLDFSNGSPTVAQPNGDFDGDGDVDVSDLFSFLDEWFAAFGNGGNCL